MSEYKTGDTAYLLESGRTVREVRIVSRAAGFYVVHFADGQGGIRVRESRLFRTEREAEAVVRKPEERKPPRRTPYDYM